MAYAANTLMYLFNFTLDRSALQKPNYLYWSNFKLKVKQNPFCLVCSNYFIYCHRDRAILYIDSPPQKKVCDCWEMTLDCDKASVFYYPRLWPDLMVLLPLCQHSYVAPQWHFSNIPLYYTGIVLSTKSVNT